MRIREGFYLTHNCLKPYRSCLIKKSPHKMFPGSRDSIHPANNRWSTICHSKLFDIRPFGMLHRKPWVTLDNIKTCYITLRGGKQNRDTATNKLLRQYSSRGNNDNYDIDSTLAWICILSECGTDALTGTEKGGSRQSNGKRIWAGGRQHRCAGWDIGWISKPVLRG